eukprot:671205-Pelagomonas_calceolata.AAC.1
MLLGMKKEAPACCVPLFAEVLVLPSVYVKCRQSGISGRRGFILQKDHVCPDAEVQISFSNY